MAEECLILVATAPTHRHKILLAQSNYSEAILSGRGRDLGAGIELRRQSEGQRALRCVAPACTGANPSAHAVRATWGERNGPGS